MKHGRTVHERVATLTHIPLQPHPWPLSSHHGLSQRLRYSDRSTSTREPTPCYQNINRQGGRGGSHIAAARPHTDAPAARGRARRPGSEQSPSSDQGTGSSKPQPETAPRGPLRAAHIRTVHGERETDHANVSPEGVSSPELSSHTSTAAVVHAVELLPSKQTKRVRVPPAAPNERGRGPRMGRSCGRSRDTRRGASRLTPTQAKVATSGATPPWAVPPGLAAVAHLGRAPGSHPGEEGCGPSRRSTSTTKRGGAAACSPVS